MNVFSSLPPEEQARQLANPDGPIGIQVAEWLNGNNAQANAKALESLHLTRGCRVLEIGFGNGSAAASILAHDESLVYAGIDISPTMLGEAERRNAAFVSSGRGSFHLASSDYMPFPGESFDRIFSIGVIHFWADPSPSLVEVRRVSRPDCLVVRGCLNPRSALPFAREEYGFYLRRPEEWGSHFHDAGFRTVDVQCIEVEGIGPNGKPNKRYTTRITARP